MDGRWIKNWVDLAKSEERISAMRIAEAGLDAIDTGQVISRSVRIDGDKMFVKDQMFDLSKFKRIKVIGFGKASCDAAQALEKVLGRKIQEGVVIGLEKKTCEFIETYEGTHPRPSAENLEVGKKIKELTDGATEDDLFIIIVSGGGSALLCYPESECEQGRILYDASVKSGINIGELNAVRKHISGLKGGGLAKLLYPATVVSLIFSDVPGDDYAAVASGPTYKDQTTIADAQKIVEDYQLGNFELTETPKDDRYFERVNNIVLVSNKIAVEAMLEKAQLLGLSAKVVSHDIYDPIEKVYGKFSEQSKEFNAVIGAGEPKLRILKAGGSGGRNLFLGMMALPKVGVGSVFIALASDGLDNSDSAGAIVDHFVQEKLASSGVDIKSYFDAYDAYSFFQKLGDGMLFTGRTGANVSDLMILVNKHD